MINKKDNFSTISSYTCLSKCQNTDTLCCVSDNGSSQCVESAMWTGIVRARTGGRAL